MGARERVDAIDLNKAKIAKHLVEIASPCRTCRGAQKQMPIKEQSAGKAVVDPGPCQSRRPVHGLPEPVSP